MKDGDILKYKTGFFSKGWKNYHCNLMSDSQLCWYDDKVVRRFLKDEEVDFIVQKVQEHGGLVSFRAEEDGTKTPYELNCSYIDALTNPNEDDAIRLKRLLVTQATVLAMPGVPGIYFHSLVGSRNYRDGVKHTGVNRTINREKYHIDWLENELSKQGSLAKSVFDSYKRLISIRINEEAFNPFGKFNFLDLGEKGCKNLIANQKKILGKIADRVGK